MDVLNHMTGSEPVSVSGCEELLRSVLGVKDKTL